MKKETLTLKQNCAGWISLRGQFPSKFIEAIRTEIDSLYIMWENDSKLWLVHYTKLPILISIARIFYDNIDYSDLLVDLNAYIDEEVLTPSQKDQFSILFLIDTAPIEVVKASYRALAVLYHPDHGGSTERMAKINRAYEIICREKNNT